MTVSPNHGRKWIEYAIVVVLLLLGTVLVATAFERLPIEGTSFALDWQSLWQGLKGGHITYAGGSVMIAPWALPAVLPLGFFSMRTGWGLLTLGTLAVLIGSVPKDTSKPIVWLSILLLVISWPALRHTADGNFEGLIIAGAVLIVSGYRRQNPLILVVGLLLATAKPQETWLLVPIVGILVLMTWPTDKWIKAGFFGLGIVIPALLLFGRVWFAAMWGIQPPPRTIIDITLGAAFQRLGLPDWVFWIVGSIMLVMTAWVLLTDRRTLSREKAAMLIALSLLLAPYAAGNTFLTVFAIGIIPLFQSRRVLGSILIGLVDLQFFLSHDFLYDYGAYYWTFLLLMVWGIFCYRIYFDGQSRLIVNAV